MYVYFLHKTGFEKSKGDQSALFVGETHFNPNSIKHPFLVNPLPIWAQHSQVQNYKTPLFGHKIPKANKIHVQVNISHILKDVDGFKFIVFCEHNFGGQYLVLGHLYAGINKIVNLIMCYHIKPVRKEEGNLIGKFLYAMTMLPGKNNAHN